MASIDKSAFIAEGVRVSGDVTIGKDCSVWYNAVLRASEGSRIVIGDRSNVQDNCTFHASNGRTVTLGTNVTIGHNAIIHGCTIRDNSVIGMGAIVMNDVIVEKNCLVGAGALLTERKVFPEGHLILGSPAKAVRPLTEAEIAGLPNAAAEYVAASAIEKGKADGAL